MAKSIDFQDSTIMQKFLTTTAVAGLKIAGPAFFLGMQGSSVKTAIGILTSKSIGSLSILPFASLFTNCVIWSLYGQLKADPTVLVPNALGVLAGLFCVGAYKRYSPNSDLTILLGALAISSFAASLFLGKNAEMLGLIGCALAIILTGSPLATLATVIREKSTNSMPFLTSMTAWCNSLSWALYGIILAKDPMVSDS